MTSPIVLDLSKEAATPISFGLSKIDKFFVELYWESKHDIDLHAIALKNGSIGGKADRILSTHNPGLVLISNPSVNIPRPCKEPFQNKQGYLKHHGDALTGIQVSGATAPDEVFEFDVNAFNASEDARDGVNTIMPVLSIHPANSAKFSEVNNVRAIFKDSSGKVLLTANLTSDYGNYDIVTIGSFELDASAKEWKFNSQSTGFNGDFNDVLAAVQ